MSHKSILRYSILTLVLLLVISLAIAGENVFKVKRVIDGDTIELENGEKVRYIGIDTPETVHPSKPIQYYGKEASEANRSLVEGKEVRLEFDVQQRDKYGRLLAYVYVGDIFVNAWLVENGYAQILTIPPNVKYQDKFLELQRKAREEGRGLWGKEPVQVKEDQKPSEEGTVYITRTGSKYHSGNCRYLSKSKIPISLKDAIVKGYSACSVCGGVPEAASKSLDINKYKEEFSPQEKKSATPDVTVYVTKTGSKYHAAGCRYLSKSRIPISLKDAIAKGYSPCSVCGGGGK
jgi:micrococcal nuclease